jgi:PAS domain S-box-containing protein
MDALTVLSPPEYRDEIRERFESGVEGTYECIGVRKDGSTFPVEIEPREVHYRGRNARVCVVRDITERKRAEEALRESEARHRRLNENIQEMVLEIERPTGQVVYVSPSHREMLGYELEEFLEITPYKIIHPDDRENVREGLRGLLREGLPQAFVFRSRHRDGRWLWIESSGNPFRTERGEGRAIVVGRDVTERKQAEEALRLSEARHRTITENAHDLITELNAEGRFVYASPNHKDQVGYAPEEIVGMPPAAFAHPQDLERVQKHFLGLISDDAPQQLTFRARHRDGRWLWLDSVGKRFHTSSGETLAVLISRDVTERKQAEEERQQLEAQFQQAQKLESLGVLAGGIAHDFNNLLTPVLGHTSRVLAEIDPDSPMRESLEQIRKTTLRAAGLTGQLLAYAGESRVVTRSVDLSELIREMADLLGTASSHKAELHYALASDLPAIEADPVQIRQVIMNLVPNASEAIGDNPGIIRVCTGVMEADRGYLARSHLGAELSEGSYVYLEVSDTGCGMDEGTKARIFDPFFTTKLLGRGLGLAALLGIVRAHRGALRVDSRPGQGTSFRVLFPSQGETAREEPTIPPTTDGWRGHGTALVVDDEEDVREVLRWMLESTGFSVLTAEDGRTGVDLFRQRFSDITVVLLDMTMPKMGGEEAFYEIRRVRPEVPILFSSGYGERDATRRLTDEKFTGFVKKPYERSGLVEKLREVLQS